MVEVGLIPFARRLPMETPTTDTSHTLRGILLFLATALIASLMFTLVRHVSATLNPLEIAFFRSLFGLVLLAPVLFGSRIRHLKTRRIGLLALHGALSSTMLLLLVTAYSLAPLAKVTAIGFTTPLFATVLAIAALGEVVRMRRVVALIVGLAGTLVILQPGFETIDAGTMAALGMAAVHAVNMIVAKVLMRTESSLTVTLYSSIFMLPVTLVATLFVWRPPSFLEVGWLFAIAASAVLVHITLVQALMEAEVSTVLPLDFTKLVWTAVFGYLLFVEIPDIWTWVGGGMISAATTFMAYRETHAKRTSG